MPLTRAEDYPLYRNHTAMMQDLAYRASRGYSYFTTGTISPEKALRFVDKMHAQYGVLLSPPERSVLKRTGRPSAYLILQPEDAYKFTLGPLHWALLATGELEGEKLLDATKKRLRWRKHYRLVHGTDAWTWELTPETYQAWHAVAQANAKKEDPREMNETLKRLLNFPMFRGVRQQVFDINKEAYRTWQRQHRNGDPEPDWPAKLPIMRKVKQRETPPRTLERYLAGLHEAAPTPGAESDLEVRAGLEPVLPVLDEADLKAEAQVEEHVAQNAIRAERDRERAEFERRIAELESRNRELQEALERRGEEVERADNAEKPKRWPWGR